MLPNHYIIQNLSIFRLTVGIINSISFILTFHLTSFIITLLEQVQHLFVIFILPFLHQSCQSNSYLLAYSDHLLCIEQELPSFHQFNFQCFGFSCNFLSVSFFL